MTADRPKPAGRWLRRLIESLAGEPQDLAELGELLADARDRGLIESDVLTMLEGVLQVSGTQVRDVMVPRSQMVVIQRDEPPERILPIVIESGHSRFPVVGDDRDEIAGILLAKDLLRYFAQDDSGHFDIRECLRPAVLIPESKRLNVLLREFRVSHNHMAIVVDEYGGVSGLVTIEDVLEQIVGDIEDEYDFDESEDNVIPEANGRFRVKAQTEIADFNEQFGTAFADDEFDTVGGLVLRAFGRLPKRGDATTMEGLRFRVLRADSRRLHTLQVERVAPAAPADGAA